MDRWFTETPLGLPQHIKELSSFSGACGARGEDNVGGAFLRHLLMVCNGRRGLLGHKGLNL